MDSKLPQKIIDWFSLRGVTPEILETQKISWDRGLIVIPVFDKTGNKVLFNKYRRDPESSEGPKYRYDKGATCQLYNLHLLDTSDEIILCEGELDSLALLSKGFVALSSTGGAGTFEESWANYLLDKKVFICYDNDDAGRKGALHVQAMVGWAKCIWLPEKVGEHGDVTDFFSKLGKTAEDFRFLMNQAKGHFIPLPLKEVPKTKKEMQLIIKIEGEYADSLLIEKRDLQNRRLPYRHIEILIDYLLQRLTQHKRTLKYMGQLRNEKLSVDNIKNAKLVPISNYIQFDRARNARCIWHNEKTASMHYYPQQNRVKCFGCNKMGDVIDVIMELKKVELKEAMEIILGKQNVQEQ